MQTLDFEKMLQEGISANGGFNKAQLTSIGVPWPPIKGWKAQRIHDGYQPTSEEYKRFVSLRVDPAQTTN